MRQERMKNRLLIGLSGIVALIAKMGSLYFSEVKGFIPCEWCWYQRILMYPLTIIYLVAYVQKNEKIIYTTLPITGLGVVLSAIHYLQQKVSLFGMECKSSVPCSLQYINWGGFITIPFLSLVGFLLITLLALLVLKNKKRT